MSFIWISVAWRIIAITHFGYFHWGNFLVISKLWIYLIEQHPIIHLFWFSCLARGDRLIWLMYVYVIHVVRMHERNITEVTEWKCHTFTANSLNKLWVHFSRYRNQKIVPHRAFRLVVLAGIHCPLYTRDNYIRSCLFWGIKCHSFDILWVRSQISERSF